MNTSRMKLLAGTIAFFVGGGASGVMAQDGESARSQSVLDEIIVTSTRRETSLQDTAISVAAISGEDIARRNLEEMNDYLRTVPGVNFVDVELGSNAVVTRGIGVNPQNEGFVSSPTSGVYFGEVSIAGLSSEGGSADIRMIDLQRIEVLRGPQGTLFGSGALAGAVRNVPNAPDLNEIGGNLKTSFSNTGGHGGDNNKVEAVVNLPLIDDVLAVRAVVYRHDTSGYTKNVAGTQLANNGFVFPGETAQESIARNGAGLADLLQNTDNNGATVFEGGRITALWKPVEDLTLSLMHLYQDAEQDGYAYSELLEGVGNYKQVDFQFGVGDSELANIDAKKAERTNLTNLVIEYDLGWANLLSSSAWFKNDGSYNLDQSGFVGQPFFNLTRGTNEVFSQELRLVSQLDGSLQYVVGVFYEDRDNGDGISSRGFAGTDEVYEGLRGGRPVPFIGSRKLYDINILTELEQLAFYGEVSYKFNEQFELTLGARRFDYERTNSRPGAGLFFVDPNILTTEEKDTNFKVNLSYTPDEDKLFYAQWSEGFRLGNTNPVVDRSTCDVNNDGIFDGTNAPITDGFDSDSVENFELGAKLSLLDQRLQINAAVYRMDWEGIPLTARTEFLLPGQTERVCFGGITVNAGKARSQGFELETIYQLTERLRITLGGAYTNAELTEDAPGLGGLDGDRLPSSPEYTINTGIQYDFELAGYPSYISADYAFIDGYYNRLGESRPINGRPNTLIGDYGELGLSAGIFVNQFSVEIFARNLTDEDAITHADTANRDDRVYQLRPRTIGLNLGYQF